MLEGFRSAVKDIRVAIAKTDLMTRGELPKGSARKEARLIHGINLTMQAINTFTAGTPVAWTTGPLAMLFAGTELCASVVMTFFTSGTTFGAADAGKGLRREAIAAFIAGATAAIPFYGHYTNAVAAGYSAAHFLNNRL